VMSARFSALFSIPGRFRRRMKTRRLRNSCLLMRPWPDSPSQNARSPKLPENGTPALLLPHRFGARWCKIAEPVLSRAWQVILSCRGRARAFDRHGSLRDACGDRYRTAQRCLSVCRLARHAAGWIRHRPEHPKRTLAQELNLRAATSLLVAVRHSSLAHGRCASAGTQNRPMMGT
jgi:hypothetical protein